jgi:hypothetical protein
VRLRALGCELLYPVPKIIVSDDPMMPIVPCLVLFPDRLCVVQCRVESESETSNIVSISSPCVQRKDVHSTAFFQLRGARIV